MNFWSELEFETKKSRRGHGTIFDEDKLIVFGGYEELTTELCALKDGLFDCIVVDQSTYNFRNYAFYPEMAIVDKNFCAEN